MTLREARCRFSSLLIDLLSWAKTEGFIFALDEGTNHQGVGHSPNSLHYSGCAQDILLYAPDGTYLTNADAYLPLGTKWKSLDPDCRWGGDFPSHDANHFSFAPKSLFGGRA